MLAKLLAAVKNKWFKGGPYKWETELPVKYREAATYSIISETSPEQDRAMAGALIAMAEEAAKPETQERRLIPRGE